jgi:hypothetical protein
MWKPGRGDLQPHRIRQEKGPSNGAPLDHRPTVYFHSKIVQREADRSSTCTGRIIFKHRWLARRHRRIYGQRVRAGRDPNQAPVPKGIDACSTCVRRNDTQVPGKSRRAEPKAELRQLDGNALDGCGKPRIWLGTPVGRELRPQSARPTQSWAEEIAFRSWQTTNDPQQPAFHPSSDTELRSLKILSRDRSRLAVGVRCGRLQPQGDAEGSGSLDSPSRPDRNCWRSTPCRPSLGL